MCLFKIKQRPTPEWLPEVRRNIHIPQSAPSAAPCYTRGPRQGVAADRQELRAKFRGEAAVHVT